jgi:hypothetical protein
MNPGNEKKLVRCFLIFAVLFIRAPSVFSGNQSSAGKLAEKSLLERFTPEQQEKLLAGEAIYESLLIENPDGSSTAYGRAIAIVNAPVDECFRMFCEFDKWRLFFPRMKTSRVLKTSGNKLVFYKELDYILTIRYTQTLTVDPSAHRVDFTIDPTGVNDIKASDGYFLFEKMDEDTLLFTYTLTKMDIGIKIPGFIQNYMASRDLPGVAVNIKKRMESGGKWQK